jgi:hypothetical protein
MRRKLIAFDDETWQALDLLRRDSMTSLQELADEAFRNLLKKHNRPTDLRTALRESANAEPTERARTHARAARRGTTRKSRPHQR